MWLKFLLWPLGIWLVATGRTRSVLVAACVGMAALLAVAPFAPIGAYVDTLRDVAAMFDQDSYSVFGLLTQLGVGDGLARGLTYALGVWLLAAVWRRRSFALTIAAALVFSPIVWLDYFALAAIPLAIGSPASRRSGSCRFSPGDCLARESMRTRSSALHVCSRSSPSCSSLPKKNPRNDHAAHGFGRVCRSLPRPLPWLAFIAIPGGRRHRRSHPARTSRGTFTTSSTRRRS